MRNLIERWLATGQIQQSDLPEIITNYAKLVQNYDATQNDIQMMMQSAPLWDWNKAIMDIASKLDMQIVSIIAQNGMIIKRYINEPLNNE